MNGIEWRVSVAAISGLSGPDLLFAFDKIVNPLLEVLVRAGQIGVAIATIIYIVKKTQMISKRRKRRAR